MSLPKPCLTCGTLAVTGYCDTHMPKDRRVRHGRVRDNRGRDGRWDRLSRMARRMQDWCSACGSRADLTTDHTPAAWAAYFMGKPIRLTMVQVLCRACNARLGEAKPGSQRWADWLSSLPVDERERVTRGVQGDERGSRAPGVSPRASYSTPEDLIASAYDLEGCVHVSPQPCLRSVDSNDLRIGEVAAHDQVALIGDSKVIGGFETVGRSWLMACAANSADNGDGHRSAPSFVGDAK